MKEKFGRKKPLDNVQVLDDLPAAKVARVQVKIVCKVISNSYLR